MRDSVPAQIDRVLLQGQRDVVVGPSPPPFVVSPNPVVQVGADPAQRAPLPSLLGKPSPFRRSAQRLRVLFALQCARFDVAGVELVQSQKVLAPTRRDNKVIRYVLASEKLVGRSRGAYTRSIHRRSRGVGRGGQREKTKPQSKAGHYTSTRTEGESSRSKIPAILITRQEEANFIALALTLVLSATLPLRVAEFVQNRIQGAQY